MVKSNQTPDTQPQLPFGSNLTGFPDSIANDEMALAGVQRAVARAQRDLDHPELQQMPMPRRRAVSKEPSVPQEVMDQARGAASRATVYNPFTTTERIREDITNNRAARGGI